MDDEEQEAPGLAGYDDPIWEYILMDRLAPYIPFVREWWKHVTELTPDDTGIFEFETEIEGYGADRPPGLFYRFTRTAMRSPIKGIQVFPFLVAGYLQLTGIKGGSTKMIQRQLAEPKDLEEFKLIELHNLPSTFNQGQLIAFVPTEIYEDVKHLGCWLYVSKKELSALLKHEVPESLYNKAVLKA